MHDPSQQYREPLGRKRTHADTTRELDLNILLSLATGSIQPKVEHDFTFGARHMADIGV